MYGFESAQGDLGTCEYVHSPEETPGQLSRKLGSLPTTSQIL
jgi:hypothetical protein